MGLNEMERDGNGTLVTRCLVYEKKKVLCFVIIVFLISFILRPLCLYCYLSLSLSL